MEVRLREVRWLRAALAPAAILSISVACGRAGNLPLIAPARAQTDSQALADRVDRLERDLNILETQVYRGGTPPATPPAPATGQPAGGGAVSGSAYDTLSQRIDQLESEIQTLTGEVEKAGHDTSVLSDRVDRLEKDTDFRLKAIEDKGGADGNPAAPGTAAAAPSPAAMAAAGSAAAPPPATGGGGASPSTSGPDGESSLAPRPLGQISADDLARYGGSGAAPGAAAPAPANPAAVTLPGKTPADQYQYAFDMLRGSNPDYAGAGQAFRAFVAQNPKSALVSNALYWEAEIAFTQADYQTAMPIFAQVYSKFPKSAKAGDSLVGFGLSLEQLKRPKDACVALNRFATDFPDADASLRAKAQAARKRLAC